MTAGRPERWPYPPASSPIDHLLNGGNIIAGERKLPLKGHKFRTPLLQVIFLARRLSL
jgi:hypothetical protein